MSSASGPDIAVVVLMEYRTGLHLLWGWGRFLFGRLALRRFAGLRFAKVMGSGTYAVPTVVLRPSNNYGPCQFPEKLR